MSFPFDLTGPQFLGFYVVAAAALLGLATAAIWLIERAAGNAGALLTDPYEIAYLRGGPAEAVKVAVLSLIDRGLLRHKKGPKKSAMLAPGPNAGTRPSHPLEREVMSRVEGPTAAEGLVAGGLPKAASLLIAPGLARRGLIVDGVSRARRQALLGGAYAILTLLFFARAAQALSHQRGNLGFIIVLWVGAGVVALLLVERLPHNGGPRVLESLALLLGDLRRGIAKRRRGRATGDLVLCAAVFGMWAVPQAMAPYAADLSHALTPPPPPPPPKSNWWNSRDDSGSGSSSSSCGGGSGSGCGGCGGGG